MATRLADVDDLWFHRWRLEGCVLSGDSQHVLPKPLGIVDKALAQGGAEDAMDEVRGVGVRHGSTVKGLQKLSAVTLDTACRAYGTRLLPKRFTPP